MCPDFLNPCPGDPVYARSMLQGLTWECPLGGNPVDCWCHDIRKWPANERMRWVSDLSDDKCLELYGQHLSCFMTKTSNDWAAGGV